MRWSIDEKTGAMLEMARFLGRDHLRPIGLECDRRGEPCPADHPFFARVAAMGWARGFALADDEARGGPRVVGRRGVLLAEELAYWDRGMTTSMPGPGLGFPPVRLLGTDEQRERLLAPFADTTRPRWGAFGMTEAGAGSDVARIRTRARRDGGAWIIDGEKMFITNGARAEWVVVWATVDPASGRSGHRAFVVERGTPGFRVARVEHKMGLVASETAALVFEDCRVPAENLLGGEARYVGREGFKGAMKSFDTTRPVIGATAIGIGRAAYDRAREIVGEARAVLERFSHMKRRLDAARLLVARAAWMADVGQENAAEASMAKAYSAQAALEVCSLAVEVCGEAGLRGDCLVEKLYRDVKALDIVEGTGQIQRIVIARRLVGLPTDDAAV